MKVPHLSPRAGGHTGGGGVGAGHGVHHLQPVQATVAPTLLRTLLLSRLKVEMKPKSYLAFAENDWNLHASECLFVSSLP